MDTKTGMGHWDEYYADIAIVQPDGTVNTIYNQGTGLVLPPGSTGGVSDQSFVEEQVWNPLTPQQTTHYYVADHLGSARMELAGGGWPVWNEDYAPYGQEINPQPTANQYKFTSYERDAESGLDFAQARHYASTLGRFMSPDPSGLAYANPAKPQSFNLYGYVGNNPLRFVDPAGLSTCTLEGIESDCDTLQHNDGAQCTSNCFMNAINSRNLSLAADLSTGSYYSNYFSGFPGGSTSSLISAVGDGTFTMRTSTFLLSQSFMSYAWSEATGGTGTGSAPNQPAPSNPQRETIQQASARCSVVGDAAGAKSFASVGMTADQVAIAAIGLPVNIFARGQAVKAAATSATISQTINSGYFFAKGVLQSNMAYNQCMAPGSDPSMAMQ